MSALAPRKARTDLSYSDAPAAVSAQPTPMPVQEAMPSVTASLPTTESAGCQVHNVRLTFDTIGTAKSLSNGTCIARLNDPLAIFQNDASITEEQLKHAIVTGITVNGVSSDCPEAIMMAMKLFENDKVGQIQNSAIGIRNEHGWLFTNNDTSFGAGTTSATSGYSNMLSIFPYERSRPATKVYDPSGVQNNRFIETYGGFNGDDLWKDIVAFPSENYYYVDKNHVVMQVISQNWDTLGINPAEEVLHENKYYKLSSALVDHVVNKLKNDVLSTIPFTDLMNLQVKFSSKNKSLWCDAPSSEDKYKIVTELKISYMFPNSS